MTSREYSKAEEILILNFIVEKNYIDKIKGNEIYKTTYTPRREKPYRVAIKGLPPLYPNDIITDLSEQGVNAVYVRFGQYKEHNNGMHIINVNQTDYNKLVKHKTISDILNVRVHFETYAGSKSLTQCRRCQNFGHAASNCNLKPKCRCPGNHLTTECTTNIDDRYCANCKKSDHSPAYKECPHYKSRIDTINKLKSERIQQHKQHHHNPVREQTGQHAAPSRYQAETAGPTDRLQTPEYNLDPRTFPALSPRNPTTHITEVPAADPQHVATYANVVTSTEKLFTLGEAISTLNELINIDELTYFITIMNNRLKDCNTKTDKFTVLAKMFIELENGAYK